MKNARKQSARVSPPALDKTSQGGHVGPENRSTQELVRDTMYSHVRHIYGNFSETFELLTDFHESWHSGSLSGR